MFFALTYADASECWWLGKDLWSESECICLCADSGHQASTYDLVASACSTCYWSSDASDADADSIRTSVYTKLNFKKHICLIYKSYNLFILCILLSSKL